MTAFPAVPGRRRGPWGWVRMNKFQCELFGHFIYDESLTYQELLDMESRFIGSARALLEGRNAWHIDFTPMGDGLAVQCAFSVYEEDFFGDICADLHQNLPPGMEGRLLFIDKCLAALHVFHFNHEKWLGKPLGIPSVRQALAMRKKNAGTRRDS